MRNQTERAIGKIAGRYGESKSKKAVQAEILERDYTALNQAYAVNAKLFHDFHNHIGVLHQFLTHGKAEEAVC